ncbi:MAG: AMP-binding protein [Chitinophagaceae bacterium]
MQHTNIVSYLAEHSRMHPHKPAFIVLEDGADIERQVSYTQLNESVKALASRLIQKNWQGQQAILLYYDVIDFIVAFLACQYAGITAVPVFFSNAAKQKARLDGILNDSGAHIILSTGHSGSGAGKLQEDIFQNSSIEWLFTDEDAPRAGNVYQPADNSQPAFIQYTSGSTGNPKGIIITAANLLANQRSISDTFGCNSDSVIFSWLPFYHDMGLIGNLLHALYVGCTCIVMSPLQFVQDPKKWLRAISKYKVTHSGGPNFAYDLCVSRISPEQVNDLDLSSWKVAYNGSEPVRADTMQQFSERFSFIGFNENAFVTCYGLAEATLLVAGVKKDNTAPRVIAVNTDSNSTDRIQLVDSSTAGARKMVSSGKLAAGVEVKIFGCGSQADRELREGEICIAGDNVTQGYWNKKDKDLFVNIGSRRFLRTGDTGFFYNNELYISGRIKEMLVVRGRNIYPYDIEQSVYKAVDGVSANGVAVFGRAELEDELVVVAELTKAALIGQQYARIIEQISNEVIAAAGITPYDIILTKPLAIPRTTSGKLQRVKCREQYEQQTFPAAASKLQSSSFTRLRDPLLKQAVLLNMDSDAVEKYLFDLISSKVPHFSQAHIEHAAELTEIGLDSIKAMELINTISKELDITVDISRVFRGNTFGSLVSLIESTLWLKNNQLSGKEIII